MGGDVTGGLPVRRYLYLIHSEILDLIKSTMCITRELSTVYKQAIAIVLAL